MKNLKYIALLFIIVNLASCNDDFLERIPETSITEEGFFNNVSDLQTYTNGFYDYLSVDVADYGSDNLSHHNSGSPLDNLLKGNITPSSVGGWEWEQLRNINFFLSRYQKAEGSAEEINHYVGIARFFRAQFYIDKVKTYGEVPWYSKPLGTNDEGLYKAKDPRALVVDSIMADLEFAIAHINEVQHKSRISKEAALAQMARFSLYEGTYRKYHTELGLSDANRFLKRAVSAAKEIMESGKFSLYSTGDPYTDYRNIFISEDLNSNPEIILFKDFDFDFDVTHQGGVVLDYEWALSRAFVDSYLLLDGSRFTDLPDADTRTLTKVFENRDPRMSQTVMPPGFINPGSTDPFRLNPTLGGYNQIKFYPKESDKIGWYQDYNDLPYFRYAETLLIFAEAKAELQTLTQGDLDNSINLIRQRAGMPPVTLVQANANPDPYLMEYYNNVSGGNTGIILEIRRERNIELVAEGFRVDDLYRWKLGEILARLPQGMYVPELGEMDVTGDGVPDIAILNKPGEEGPISDVPEDIRSGLSSYYLYDSEGRPTTIFLENETSGHIMFTQDVQSPKSFVEPKYYYWPIPETQLLLNENLTQSTGW